jgi:hypothetical protein
MLVVPEVLVGYTPAVLGAYTLVVVEHSSAEQVQRSGMIRNSHKTQHLLHYQNRTLDRGLILLEVQA